MSISAQSPRPSVSSAGYRSTAGRRRLDSAFVVLCLATALMSILILVVLLGAIGAQGRHHLNWSLLTQSPNPDPNQAGIRPAMWGTIWACLGCAFFALPLGVSTAILLEEYKPRSTHLRRLLGIVQLNIANLAGVPSVVYGIIGLTAFAAMFGLFGQSNEPVFEIGAQYFDQFVTEGRRVVQIPVASRQAPATVLVDALPALTPKGNRVTLRVIAAGEAVPTDKAQRRYAIRSDAQGSRIDRKHWYYISLPFGRGLLTGSLTLMLVVLPIVIIASQEALRAVPSSLREGALGMGATRWQTIWNVTLPAAVPGIMTGAILAMSRAIGEAAPILMISGIIGINYAPGNLMDDFTVMPLQIYDWAQRPNVQFHDVAASAILLLLAVLFVFNALAVVIRQRYHKPLS